MDRTVSLSRSAEVCVERRGRGASGESGVVDRICAAEICCLAAGACLADRAEERAETAPLLLRAEVEASAAVGPREESIIDVFSTREKAKRRATEEEREK